jgi:hypothetical protein
MVLIKQIKNKKECDCGVEVKVVSFFLEIEPKKSDKNFKNTTDHFQVLLKGVILKEGVLTFSSFDRSFYKRLARPGPISSQRNLANASSLAHLLFFTAAYIASLKITSSRMGSFIWSSA